MIMLKLFYFVLLFNYGTFPCYGRKTSNSSFKKLNPPPAFFANPNGNCAPTLRDCQGDTIFYSYDGSCNNLQHSYFGQTSYPFERILPAKFPNGYDQLRVSVDGSPLPSSRVIRTTILPNKEYRDSELRHNVLFYAFAQFNNHDASEQGSLFSNGPCCENGNPVSPMPYECLPTIMPADDEFYSQFGVTCVSSMRSVNTRTKFCGELSPIRQINFQTSFLDLSILYGSNEQRAREIRLFEGGFLKSGNDTTTCFQEYPFIMTGFDKCPIGGLTPAPGNSCFYSGDYRINSVPEMFVTNALFFRLHNYLAQKLQEINQNWDDEKLYQMARRICIAIYQNIFGAEFVPAIIGSDAASLYALYPAADGYISGYNPEINPQTFHEYTASAARTGHSHVRGSFTFNGPSGQTSYRLREKFFSLNFFLEKDVFLNIIEAFTFQQCDRLDEYFTEELNNFALPQVDLPYGNDLSAVDIDRGREYGVESYNSYRVACGMNKLEKFEDLANEITKPTDIEKLKSLYHHVDDIDLYVGGILELPYKDSTVGPTLTCILGAQFQQWKFGDRKFYEFQTAEFTPEQLKTLRSTTYAQILCISVPQLEWVPKNAFYVETNWNPVIRCDSIERIDLSKWKE